MSSSSVLWEPPPDVRKRSRIGQYLLWLESKQGLSFASYNDLWRWSVEDLEGFWSSIWEFFAVHGDPPPTQTLADPSMPGARWFPGTKLNYAEHMLRTKRAEAVVIGKSQTRDDTSVTMDELCEHVSRCRRGLQRLGVGRGDRVVAYLPNIPETLAAFLATASLGAIWSSCPPEFGTRSVTDRFRQINPKVLLAIDGYRYGDRSVERHSESRSIAAALPSLEATVFVPYLDAGFRSSRGELLWADLLADAGKLRFDPVDFDHPLYVLYSSGTTGLPKPIVHGHGGILLEHLKAIALHLDIGSGDRFFWYSTTGWMVWNFLVSGLLVGATIVLLDGDPGWPDLTTLWRLVESTGITYFGISAPFLVSCQKAGIKPFAVADLSTLRGIGSTGAPLPPATAEWIYDQVPPSAQLGSFSGGTDVCTSFVGAVPLMPVRADEIACRCLGAKVEAYTGDGTSVINEVGELMITAPMPSMPVGFWGDDGTRYRAAYFEQFPDVWRHGDWITITERGSCIISGRSDATLNRGGVRLGTAEIYATVEAMPEIADSLVVHLEDTRGGGLGELVLFVVPNEGVQVSEEFVAEVNRLIRNELSPRHVPDRVHAVPAIPRTLSGKKLEVPIKRLLSGVPVKSVVNEGALANPESLKAFLSFAGYRSDQNRKDWVGSRATEENGSRTGAS